MERGSRVRRIGLTLIGCVLVGIVGLAGCTSGDSESSPSKQPGGSKLKVLSYNIMGAIRDNDDNGVDNDPWRVVDALAERIEVLEPDFVTL